MKNRSYLLFILFYLFVITVTRCGKPDFLLQRDVFVGGRNGYHTYRIPALVLTNNHTLLAFCEGRKTGAGDTGDIDLLVKRSTDGGKTWSEQLTVHEQGGDAAVTIGNPCPIIERNSNRIHLLFTQNNKRLYYCSSTDDGKSWSVPQQHSNILKDLDYDLVRIATGPVHGIELKSGRLLAPIWVCNRDRDNIGENPPNNRYQAGVIFSDDSGRSWKTGGLVPPVISRLNEGTVVQRKDGSLLLNLRAHGSGFRALSMSSDGGMTWSKPVLDRNLPCPTCQAGMIRLGDDALLFLNPAVSKTGGYNPGGRRNLTLRLSRDQGRSWPHSLVIHKGPAGYSDLAVSPDGTVFCLFENGREIYREKISLVALKQKKLIAN